MNRLITHLLIFMSLTGLSCGFEKDNPLMITDQLIDAQHLSEMWICHNPGTSYHGLECDDHCYTPGNTSNFCWLLTVDDCVEPYILSWQDESCPALKTRE